jgi:hypothetical protein
MVSILRLSHFVHFAVWTLTSIQDFGLVVHWGSVPLAVRRDELGVLGAMVLEVDVEVGEEAPGVTGRSMGEFVGTGWSGGEGVFLGEAMLVYRLEPEDLNRDVVLVKIMRSNSRS